MPLSQEKFLSPAIDPDRYGAGGEPLGEPPAPPPRSRKRSGLSEALDGAVDRARLLGQMVKRADGERIPDEVIDQLLAGAETEQEIAGPGGLLARKSSVSVGPGATAFAVMPSGASSIAIVRVRLSSALLAAA